jgi:DNA-binding MarR family transcriptional regulator
VTYAVLTQAGVAKLREASKTHVADIREIFETRFNAEELDQLVALLERLPHAADATGEACSAP